MRALVKVSFYINVKDDESAEYKARYIASRLSKTHEECIVESVDEVDFMSVPIKNIYSLKNIEDGKC